MELGLEGKRALVLAGTSGLGLATARELVLAGARVMINGRDAQRAERVAAELRALGGGEPFVAAGDVSEPVGLEGVFAEAEASLGGLDLLLLNAGGPPAGGFEELDDGAWQAAVELTLMSVVRSVRLALPLMRRAGGGAVVAVGSSSVRDAIPGLTLSNTIRPAVRALMRELATTLGAEGIRFNYLSPGRIITPRLDALDGLRSVRVGKSVEELRAASASRVPLGRLGESEEFGRVAAFLLSGAASYVTGQSLLVDGGMVTAL